MENVFLQMVRRLAELLLSAEQRLEKFVCISEVSWRATAGHGRGTHKNVSLSSRSHHSASARQRGVSVQDNLATLRGFWRIARRPVVLPCLDRVLGLLLVAG